MVLTSVVRSGLALSNWIGGSFSDPNWDYKHPCLHRTASTYTCTWKPAIFHVRKKPSSCIQSDSGVDSIQSWQVRSNILQLVNFIKSFNVMFPRVSLTQSFCDGFISRKKISHKMFEQPECARVWFNVSRARPSYKLHHLIESTFRVHHPPFVSYPSPFWSVGWVNKHKLSTQRFQSTASFQIRNSSPNQKKVRTDFVAVPTSHRFAAVNHLTHIDTYVSDCGKISQACTILKLIQVSATGLKPDIYYIGAHVYQSIIKLR